ncbi:MAG: hypothetical protein V3T21_02035 [Candidatus Margulisiibacteriota bacterium]
MTTMNSIDQSTKQIGSLPESPEGQITGLLLDLVGEKLPGLKLAGNDNKMMIPGIQSQDSSLTVEAQHQHFGNLGSIYLMT